ncbi:hypothetical protein GW17_00042237, partial [Ensete ventricosum]
VIKWEQIPVGLRAHLNREKQPTNMLFSSPMQISYLQNLGCTINPTSRLHASRLIEQYRSL